MTAAIRLAVEADAEAIQAIYAPYVLETVISFELEPPDVTTMRERINKTLETHAWLVCEHKGEIVGYAYASKHRERHAYQWSVDVTAYVRPEFHRSGIGRGLYTSLFPLLCLQGYFSAFAGIALPNDASIGLHKAVGFEPIGVYPNVGYKFDKWHNVAWLGRALQPPAASPTPPRPLAEVMNSVDWQAAINKGLTLIRL
jgi:L-amino acid N-acyltransferase YncA